MYTKGVDQCVNVRGSVQCGGTLGGSVQCGGVHSKGAIF